MGYQGYGQQGPMAPKGGGDETGLSVLSYLGLLGSLLIPLLIYLMKKAESPYIRHHAAQALNLSLTSAIYFVAIFVVAVPVPILDSMGYGPPAIAFLVLFYVLQLANAIVTLVFMIIGAAKASRPEWYWVPTWRSFRMIK